jgi:hypothetical protein
MQPSSSLTMKLTAAFVWGWPTSHHCISGLPPLYFRVPKTNPAYAVLVYGKEFENLVKKYGLRSTS